MIRRRPGVTVRREGLTVRRGLQFGGAYSSEGLAVRRGFGLGFVVRVRATIRVRLSK